jgi:hypothetical protein|tara:strand:- start:896 stop:1249 length:354 start_codon:yes stop_codon:yes gene_type:complete
MYRRRIQGQGLAVRVATADIEMVRHLIEICYCPSWQERADREEKYLETAEIEDKGFITSVMRYISSQQGGLSLQERRTFVKVHWFTSPSYYTMNRLPAGSDHSWVPISWLKEIKAGR